VSLPPLIEACSDYGAFEPFATLMALLVGCRFHLVFLQAIVSASGHWVLGNPAFTMLASPCESFLAAPALPHSALPTGYALRRVSLSAQSVGLVGFTLHLPTEFFELNSVRRYTAHVATNFGTKRQGGIIFVRSIPGRFKFCGLALPTLNYP
jgi:hypothetical protein